AAARGAARGPLTSAGCGRRHRCSARRDQARGTAARGRGRDCAALRAGRRVVSRACWMGDRAAGAWWARGGRDSRDPRGSGSRHLRRVRAMAVEVYESGTPEENVPAPRRARPDLPGEADEEVIGGPEPGRGPLLDLPPRKAAELAARLYFGQDEHLSRKIAQWQVNRLRQRGVPGVGIRRDPDTGRWRAYVPPVVTPDTIPSVRKAWVLCQKLTNILLADPPAADPVP